MPRTDFNNDGRDDILWRNSETGEIGTWLRSPGGGFTVDLASLAAVSSDWTVNATGDFDNDGRDDILWFGPDGWAGIWFSSASGGFTPNALLTKPGSLSDFAGIGDFVGDGRDDHAWLSAGSTESVFSIGEVSEAGQFWNYTHVRLPGSQSVAAIGDFNGDNRDDFLTVNLEGVITLVRGTASDVWGHGVISVMPSGWAIVGTGDFNGDGFDDVLWRHADGHIGTWDGVPNESGFFAVNPVLTFAPLDWEIQATGDYNGGGRDDILWRHTDGTIGIWLGEENGGWSIDQSATIFAATDWIIQPNRSGAGEWDY